MKVTATEIYRCTPEFYFDKYFDPESRKTRETEGVGSLSWDLIENTQEGGKRRIRAKFVEKLDAPAAIRKIFGETSAFEEDSVWREGSNVIDMDILPEKMAKKMSLKGRYIVDDQGDGTCKVTLEMEVKVKIFGLGGLIEKMATKEVPHTFGKDAKYFNEHIAQ